jgi:hypothetical protein
MLKDIIEKKKTIPKDPKLKIKIKRIGSIWK